MALGLAVRHRRAEAVCYDAAAIVQRFATATIATTVAATTATNKVPAAFYIILGKFGGSKLQPFLVQKRRLGTYYDLYEKAEPELEKLQNPSVFQLKSANRSIRRTRGLRLL